MIPDLSISEGELVMKLKSLSVSALGIFFAAAVANAGTLKCVCLDSGEDLFVKLESGGQVISAETGSATPSFNKEAYVGDLDTSYRPRVVGNVRYLVRNSGFDKTRIIVDSNILSGRPGKMRIEGNTDSYWSRRYKCR